MLVPGSQTQTSGPFPSLWLRKQTTLLFESGALSLGTRCLLLISRRLFSDVRLSVAPMAGMTIHHEASAAYPAYPDSHLICMCSAGTGSAPWLGCCWSAGDAQCRLFRKSRVSIIDFSSITGHIQSRNLISPLRCPSLISDAATDCRARHADSDDTSRPTEGCPAETTTALGPKRLRGCNWRK